ncbi:MAG TPA: 3-phosphoshikimate 1-carboxyvinyltransferase, partial [Candidatus Polarisedimenticolaceae bacterium]|nr:3-phosphoshikimate 1-carboxyvinyltransferase [Candidatus Polarisedimenticolaceae bacterium]
RFLLAMAALGARSSRLDGDARLRERPLGELAEALREIGARCETADGGRLPARAGGSTVRGGAVRVAGRRSSQFASALLLIGSTLADGLRLAIEPPVVSSPYLRMTIDTLVSFGGRVDRSGDRSFRVVPGPLGGREVRIEGDHSSASYFLAAAAVVGGRVRVCGLTPASHQPDAALGGMLAAAGCLVRRGADWIEVEHHGPLRPLDLDMADSPDLVPTVAVAASFAGGTSVLRNIAHLRHKESDRLTTIATNLARLGCPAEIGDDSLTIASRGRPTRGALIETASDHRIAMAFALAGLAVEGVAVDDARCVAKSNPRFWQQLAWLTA